MVNKDILQSLLIRRNNINVPFYPKYDLLITGHSLGGSVASVLGLLLKREFSNLLVYTTGTVGCTMTYELSEYMKPFCTTLVFGKDFIPRLSKYSSFKMLKSLSYCLGHTDAHKIAVFKSCFRKNSDVPLLSEVGSYDSRIMLMDDREGFDLDSMVRLYPPGKRVF